MSNGAVAAGVAAHRRRIMEAYRAAGAVSRAGAKTPAELGLRNTGILRTLRRRGVLVETSGGRLYLDERAAAEDAARRRQVSWLVLVLLGIFAVVGVALAVFNRG